MVTVRLVPKFDPVMVSVSPPAELAVAMLRFEIRGMSYENVLTTLPEPPGSKTCTARFRPWPGGAVQMMVSFVTKVMFAADPPMVTRLAAASVRPRMITVLPPVVLAGEATTSVMIGTADAMETRDVRTATAMNREGVGIMITPFGMEDWSESIGGCFARQAECCR